MSEILINASEKTERTDFFHCCCSITRNEFDINGTTGVLIVNEIVLVLTSIVATIGNLLVLISIWRTPSLHSPSNILLFGLAASDLGVGLVAEPINFVFNISKMNGSANVFCNSAIALRFTSSFLCVASLFTITCISLDMYIALYLHLRYEEIVTVKTMTLVLIGIWLLSFTDGLLYIWYAKRLWLLWTCLVILLLLVTTSAYYKVYGIVRHHQRDIDAQVQVGADQAEAQGSTSCTAQHDLKSLISKFLVYSLFVFCYLPFTVMIVVSTTTGLSVTKQAIQDVFLILVYLNSTINPFVYCWRFQNIRVAVIETAKQILRYNCNQ